MTITVENQDTATEKQIKFIKDLLNSREIESKTSIMANIELASGITKPRASQIITWLKEQPHKAKEAPVQALEVVDGPGVYVGSSGSIYVAANKPHTSYLLWRRVIIRHDAKPILARIYSGMAKTDINTAGGYRMSLEEADAFGQSNQFNGLSFCLLCGRRLTASESVHYGVGPVCRGKSVWA